MTNTTNTWDYYDRRIVGTGFWIFEKCLEYYYTKHNRNSTYDNGSAIAVRVRNNYPPSTYPYPDGYIITEFGEYNGCVPASFDV